MMENKIKKSKLKDLGLYFITDSKLTKKNVVDDVKAAIQGGIKIVQYREKNASARQMLQDTEEIKKLCQKNNVLFLINDRIDIALAVDADGAHIGQDDMPYETARKLLGNKKIIGMTIHNVKEALEAEKKGADYVALSPIFETSTKSDAGNACGASMITKVIKKIKIPIVAIGGINEKNIDNVLKAGAKNIAMISAIVGKDDVEMVAKKFISKISSYKKHEKITKRAPN